MDRARFDHLLAAYGADFGRWPAEERAAAAAFAHAHADELAAAIAEARALDSGLDLARGDPTADVASLLEKRILASAPKRQTAAFDRRAVAALAACAVFGVLIGYGGGLLAPLADDDDSYFTMAFEAPGDEG